MRWLHRVLAARGVHNYGMDRAAIDVGVHLWMTTKQVKDLVELGEYDRAIVLEYAAQRKSEYALKRLEKILDTFERSVSAVA